MKLRIVCVSMEQKKLGHFSIWFGYCLWFVQWIQWVFMLQTVLSTGTQRTLCTAVYSSTIDSRIKLANRFHYIHNYLYFKQTCTLKQLKTTNEKKANVNIKQYWGNERCFFDLIVSKKSGFYLEIWLNY